MVTRVTLLNFNYCPVYGMYSIFVYLRYIAPVERRYIIYRIERYIVYASSPTLEFSPLL